MNEKYIQIEVGEALGMINDKKTEDLYMQRKVPQYIKPILVSAEAYSHDFKGMHDTKWFRRIIKQ